MKHIVVLRICEDNPLTCIHPLNDSIEEQMIYYFLIERLKNTTVYKIK